MINSIKSSGDKHYPLMRMGKLHEGTYFPDDLALVTTINFIATEPAVNISGGLSIASNKRAFSVSSSI